MTNGTDFFVAATSQPSLMGYCIVALAVYGSYDLHLLANLLRKQPEWSNELDYTDTWLLVYCRNSVSWPLAMAH